MFKVQMIDKNIGIVGYGKMGKLLANIFSKKFKIGVYSPDSSIDEYRNFESLEDLFNNSDIICIAISRRDTIDVLDILSNIESCEEKIIFDISTFKEGLMEKYRNFPPNVKVASIHPMFGEGIDSLKDENVIIVPIEGRKNDSEYIVDLLEELEVNISQMNVEKHDEIMKVVIGIPYFFGISYLDLISKYENIEDYGGTSFEYMSIYSKSILNDSPEFISEVIENSKDVIEEYFKNLEIENVDIEKLREEYKEEIEESYLNFYNHLR